MPTMIELDVGAVRNLKGLIIFRGSTNLPDDTKLGVDLSLRTKRIIGQDKMLVKDGRFLSEGFNNNAEPWPPGKYRVRIISYFNKLWQTPELLDIIGPGGIKLPLGGLVKWETKPLFGKYRMLEYEAEIELPRILDESGR